MSSENPISIKSNLHIRNRNNQRYDIEALMLSTPELEEFVKPNKYGDNSIDFADPLAVKLLNQSILKYYYKIEYWDFPEDNLTPPIPGRADYLHYVADLLAEYNNGTVPTGSKIVGLDVGIGANAIYPIIGAIEYEWNFIGSDISDVSIASAQNILEKNDTLKGKVEIRHQENSKNILEGIVGEKEEFDFTIINPPFYATIDDATKGTRRKVKNLTGNKISNPPQNFGGISKELVYEGGEYQFIKNLIKESITYSKNCFWYTTLISKQSNVPKVRKILERSGVIDLRTIKMGTSNKSTRIMAWTFLTKEEQIEWAKNRWSDHT